MAATGTPTPNIGLRIPHGTDPASVDDINYNSNLLDTKLGAVGNTSVQDQIDSLNSKLSPSYVTTELNLTNATIISGGYAKIERLVVVNLRINVTTQITAGSIFVEGLPSYANMATETVISVQNNRNLDITLTRSGSMSVAGSAIPTGTLVVSCTYIAN